MIKKILKFLFPTLFKNAYENYLNEMENGNYYQFKS